MGLFGKKEIIVKSPLAGYAKPLENLHDGAFSTKMMGDGIVVTAPEKAEEVDILSPIDGELTVAFPTGHAYGIKGKHGIEILVHIGIDTVNLDGHGFKQLVKQGQKVKAGQPLVKANIEYIRQNKYKDDVIVIVTSGQTLSHHALANVTPETKLFVVEE